MTEPLELGDLHKERDGLQSMPMLGNEAAPPVSLWRQRPYQLAALAIIGAALLFAFFNTSHDQTVGSRLAIPHKTPATFSQWTGGSNKVLFAVKSYDSAIARRELVRRTWGQVAVQTGQNDLLFYLGHVAPHYRAVIEAEQAEYGDLVLLDHIPENHITGTSIKAFEFFKHVLNTGTVVYRWVCHVDDDTFLNIPNMMTWLKPDAQRTVVGRYLGMGIPNDPRQNMATYPVGQFYGFTWDMLAAMSHPEKYYLDYNYEGAVAGTWRIDDDIMIGEIIAKAFPDTKMVNLPWENAYNLVSPLAPGEPGRSPENIEYCLHPNTSWVHNLKTDGRFAWVSAHFSSRGWIQDHSIVGGSDCDSLRFPNCTCLPTTM